MPTATDPDDHLVEAPVGTRPWTAATRIAGGQQAELQKPATDGLIGDVNAALGQQVLGVAKGQREPGMEPDRVPDDPWRKTMSLERYRGHSGTAATPDRPDQTLNGSMPGQQSRFELSQVS